MNEKSEKQVRKTIKYLNRKCSNIVKNEIKNSEIEDLYKFHFSIGIWIRDNILKENSKISLVFSKEGIKNKDEISSIIIYEFYKFPKSQIFKTES